MDAFDNFKELILPMTPQGFTRAHASLFAQGKKVVFSMDDFPTLFTELQPGDFGLVSRARNQSLEPMIYMRSIRSAAVALVTAADTPQGKDFSQKVVRLFVHKSDELATFKRQLQEVYWMGVEPSSTVDYYRRVFELLPERRQAFLEGGKMSDREVGAVIIDSILRK